MDTHQGFWNPYATSPYSCALLHQDPLQPHQCAQYGFPQGCPSSFSRVCKWGGGHAPWLSHAPASQATPVCGNHAPNAHCGSSSVPDPLGGACSSGSLSLPLRAALCCSVTSLPGGAEERAR